MNENSIKISKIYEKDILNYAEKNNFNIKLLKNDNYNLSGSSLESATSQYRKKYDIKNMSGTVRFSFYDDSKYEETILNFLGNELKSIEYETKYNVFKAEENLDKEIDFIYNYMQTIEDNYNYAKVNLFQNKISDIFLDSISKSNNDEVIYLSNQALEVNKGNIEKEVIPDYFAKTVNGYSEVYDVTDDIARGLVECAIYATVSAISGAIAASIAASGGSVGVVIPLIISTLSNIGLVVSAATATSLLSFVVGSGIKLLTKNLKNKMIDFLKKLLQKDRVENLIEKNKNLINKEYGSDIWKKYSDFFKEGFGNGISGKWDSLWGKTSIKDRAILLFDKKKNPLWNLDTVKVNSSAQFVKVNGFYSGSYEVALRSNENITMYTSVVATKSNWTGTYMGYTDNPNEKSYTLKKGLWLLKKTTLKIEPHFTKKSISVSKSLFISENIKNSKDFAYIYQLSPETFKNYVSSDVKYIYSKYPVYNQSVPKKLKAFNKLFNY